MVGLFCKPCSRVEQRFHGRERRAVHTSPEYVTVYYAVGATAARALGMISKSAVYALD
jgi:hypothetical protein